LEIKKGGLANPPRNIMIYAFIAHDETHTEPQGLGEPARKA
jgi:hypothetical protein